MSLAGDAVISLYEMGGPPFSVPAEQVRVLFAEHFELTAHDRRDGLPRSENLKFRGLSHLVEAVYVLRRLG